MQDTISSLHAEQELAMLRADLATSSPQSYSIEEMKSISNDLDAKTEALDDAIREDFNSMPPDVQAKMLRLLIAAGGVKEGFWGKAVALGIPACFELNIFLWYMFA